MSPLIREALLHGAALSAGMTAIILVSIRHDCEVWLGDYPPDVRAAYGKPKPARAVRRGRVWSLVTLALLVAVHASLFVRLAAAEGGLSFGPAFLAAYLCFSVFNLVDLVVIDLGVMLGLRPTWAILPGTDPSLKGYRDAWFHVRAFLIGCVGGLVLAALAAALGVLALG